MVLDTPENVWDDVIDVNLKGLFLAAKYAVPETTRRTTSPSTPSVPPRSTPRCCAARRISSRGIGTVEQILDAWGRSHPIGRIGQPSEITEAVAFLAGEKARFTTGADLKVDGGLMAKIGVVLPD